MGIAASRAACTSLSVLGKAKRLVAAEADVDGAQGGGAGCVVVGGVVEAEEGVASRAQVTCCCWDSISRMSALKRSSIAVALVFGRLDHRYTGC